MLFHIASLFEASLFFFFQLNLVVYLIGFTCFLCLFCIWASGSWVFWYSTTTYGEYLLLFFLTCGCKVRIERRELIRSIGVFLKTRWFNLRLIDEIGVYNAMFIQYVKISLVRKATHPNAPLLRIKEILADIYYPKKPIPIQFLSTAILPNKSSCNLSSSIHSPPRD